MMKKIFILLCVLMFALSSVCFSKGASVSSGGGSRSSISTSSSTSRSTSISPSTKSSSSGVSSTKPSTNAPATSGGGISTTQKKQDDNLRRDAQQSTIDRNRYNNSYAGHSSFGTGLMAGLVAGSLFHPWSTIGYGGGYVAAPMGFSIIFFIIDLLILFIFFYIIYRVWKSLKN